LRKRETPISIGIIALRASEAELIRKNTASYQCMTLPVNEVGLQVVYFMATEAVLFEKLGENEGVEAIDFGINQQKKLRRSEHPTLAGQRQKPVFSKKNFDRLRRSTYRRIVRPLFFAKIFDRLRRST
jgi:hypothetical protein